MAMQILAKGQPNSNSSYSLKNLEINSAEKNDLLIDDFENVSSANSNKTWFNIDQRIVTRAFENISSANITDKDWINNSPDLLSTSFISDALTGNNSLKVNVGKGNTTNWSILSTDFIPVKEDVYYNYSLDISAKDVNQLHSKVIYYDSNKKELTWDFIFSGRDGSFNNTIHNSLLPVLGTKYIKLQTLVHPNLPSSAGSTYLIDNVKVSSYLPPQARIILKDDFATFKSTNASAERVKVIDDSYPTSLRAELSKSSQPNSAIETIPFPVKENTSYNYTMTVDSNNLSSLTAQASFRNSVDVVVNLTKYGASASNGGVLTLHPGSEISTQLDILKPSNYTISLRTNNCATCMPLKLTIEDKNSNVIHTSNVTTKSGMDTSNSTMPQLIWYSSNIHLNKGEYNMKINSDSERDVDSFIVYTNSNNTISGDKIPPGVPGFVNTNLHSVPAYVAKYNEINPTKYEVTVKNATKPFILSFAESYDPLWKVYSTDTDTVKTPQLRTNSVPLYSTINGFYINKTGNYTLNIEYEPQKWFLVGGIVSVITSIFWACFILAKRFKKHHFISKTG